MASKLLELGLRLILSLLLLSTVINGKFDALEKKLNEMAENSKKINDLFVPSKNGTIKRGGFGLVFKGTRVADGKSVALKFMRVENRYLSDHEFRIYGYLNAINTTHVEEFGIPALYYYNEWKGYKLTVLSLYDGGDLEDLSSRGYFNHKRASLAINSFLLFRDFVIQSKYMHSRGVRHDDINPENIVVRGGRSYLIDFKSASKMTEERRAGTVEFLPRKVYNGETRTAKSDWESFLYTMAYINRIELGWFFSDSNQDPALNEWIGICIKNNTDHIVSKIDGAPIASPALKRVFQQFASAALLNQNSNPPYETMLEFINSEMDSIFESGDGKYKGFTWLKDDARKGATRQSEGVDIQNIHLPRNSFHYAEYPLNYFPKPIPRQRSLLRMLSSSGSKK